MLPLRRIVRAPTRRDVSWNPRLGRKRAILLLWTSLAMGAGAPSAGAPSPAPGKALADAHPLGGLLRNPLFEGTAAPDGWSLLDPSDRVVKVQGRRALRCQASPGRTHHGATQVVPLHQERPFPIVAAAFSRCEGVPSPASVAYSLYLDLTFTDGTTSFAHCAFFSPGTHGWERRQVRIFPPKPLRQVAFHLIFRALAGTAFFCDPSLVELRSGPNALPFDGCLVSPPPAGSAAACDLHLRAGDTLALGLESRTGRITRLMVGGETWTGAGGFLVRDQAAAGPFEPVRGSARQLHDAIVLTGETPRRDVSLRATFRAVAGTVRVSARVFDRTGRDRALTLYLVLPVRTGLVWWDDARRARLAADGEPLENTVPYPVAGAGWVSRYPLACVAGRATSLCVGLPLTMPRFTRLTYYPALRETVVAWDLGLSRRVRRTPGWADVSVTLYSAPADWGFRAALAGYYRLFPHDFAKRIPKEGLWIFLPGASAVRQPEDFGFAYQEGAASARWDEEHGLLTFAYTEPVSFWMALPKEQPRTEAACQQHLARLAAEERRAGRPGLACTTERSACRSPEGIRQVVVVNAFGVDGGMWILNPNPAIPPEGKTLSAGQFKLAEVRAAIQGAMAPVPSSWESGQGVLADAREKHGGARSLRVTLPNPGGWAGSAQTVLLNQERPEPLLLSAWSRADRVQGVRGNDYAVYVDFVYRDGTPLFAQTVTFETGTHGWQYSEREIRPEKPLRSATLHCFLRNACAGTAWFDDLFLGPRGGRNLLANGGFEGPLAPPAQVDGAYVDSLEMAGARMDFDPEHIAYARQPLAFDPATAQVGVANILAQYEFVQTLAQEMRAQGKAVLANDVLRTFPWFAAHLDVLGTETNWFAPGPQGGPSEWAPMTDADLLYRRALAGRKPYCFLQNTPFDHLTGELVERYLLRSLFYAMYPGMFADSDTGGHYFANPEWYERDRPLFRRIVPLIRTLSRAGWEPVTRVRSAPAGVLVERYGAPPGPVYLTVMNDASRECRYTLTLEKSLREGRVLCPLLARRPPEAQQACITGSLYPWETQVLGLLPQRGGARSVSRGVAASGPERSRSAR